MQEIKNKMIKDLPVVEIVKKEEELYNYDGDDRIIPASELQLELLKSDSSVFNLKTGILSMDRILDGVECGELVVVTGLSGYGKTTFLMTLTNNMADMGIKSVWFTLEVTPRQFLKKMSMRSVNLPEFYIPKDNKDNSLYWIEERILEAKTKYDSKVVFIDHINMIYSLEHSKGNVSLELADLVAKIKQIAIKYNQVIFLVAHCKDTIENKEPTERDIRDSGMIVRLADTVMGIWRVRNDSDPKDTKLKVLDEDDNQAKVRIWKNRRTGKLGYFFMEHKDHYLTEIEKNDDLTKFVDAVTLKPIKINF